MVFNSLSFILFFAIVLAVHHLPLPWAWRKLNLVIFSFLFYAAWNPPWVLLLLGTVTLDFFVGLGLGTQSSPGRRHLLLTFSLIANLGVLGALKYGAFLAHNFQLLLDQLGIGVTLAEPGWILPIGVSFYTFHSLSYVFDLYRGKTSPCRSFVDFALYVTFFPQLVAGPIMRAGEFLPQCARPGRSRIGEGLAWLTLGLFLKVALADAIFAPAAGQVFDAPGAVGRLAAWTGTLAFAGQIFCDFCGYSSCAIGAGLCLGFRLRRNFQAPYAALGFQDFWRRWHLSLSSWFRDYLYIPLGGNRHGAPRTTANILMTMTIAGIWHGASWTFAFWGLCHGLLLLLERALKAIRVSAPAPVVGVATFLCVSVAWVFFRAKDLVGAFRLLSAMFGQAMSGAEALSLPGFQVAIVGIAMGGVVLSQVRYRDREFGAWIQGAPGWALAVSLSVMLVLTVLSLSNPGHSFVYFQF